MIINTNLMVLTFGTDHTEPFLDEHEHDTHDDIKDKKNLCFFVDNKNHKLYNEHANVKINLHPVFWNHNRHKYDNTENFNN